MQRPQSLLREYVGLCKKRVDAGITPLEYQRWLDLGQQLEKAFPGHPPLGKRGETRMIVEFDDREQLADSVMMNIRPVGLFIHTPFAPDQGTKLDLRVHVLETSEIISSRVIVISNNVGPDFSTQALGMGVKFRDMECELRALLEKLCGPPTRNRSKGESKRASD